MDQVKNDILKYCDCTIPIFNMLNGSESDNILTQFMNKYDEMSDIIGLVSRNKMSERVEGEIHHLSGVFRPDK